MRICFGVLLLAACGSVGSNPDAAVQPDSRSIDAAIDAPPPPPCDLTKPFGTLTNVAGVNTAQAEAAGWFSADLLTIYYASSLNPNADRNIYSATRSSPTGAFSGAAPMGGSLNTTAGEDRPVVTADGLTMFLETTATGTVDIHVATRTDPSANFGAHTQVAIVNDTTMVDWNPWLSADGLTLYFGSNRGGNYDLYRTTRASAASQFAQPTAVGELNSTSDDYTPVLSADGLEIFFASYRAGHNNNDIWRATRSTATDGFGSPQLVTELNGDTTDEYVTWVSPNRCSVLFTSTRSGGSGSQDIWLAVRPQ
jgi:hypothetical protein